MTFGLRLFCAIWTLTHRTLIFSLFLKIYLCSYRLLLNQSIIMRNTAVIFYFSTHTVQIFFYVFITKVWRLIFHWSFPPSLCLYYSTQFLLLQYTIYKKLTIIFYLKYRNWQFDTYFSLQTPFLCDIMDV